MKHIAVLVPQEIDHFVEFLRCPKIKKYPTIIRVNWMINRWKNNNLERFQWRFQNLNSFRSIDPSDRKRIISVVQREIPVPLYLAEKVGGNVAFGIVPTLRVYISSKRERTEPVARQSACHRKICDLPKPDSRSNAKCFI